MLRAWLALSALLFASSACAQFSGSVGVLSDYRYRGVSLSDGKPAAQLSLAYDRADGGYAGLLVSSVRLPGRLGAGSLLLPYVGYAHSLRPDLSAEIGVQYSRFSSTHFYNYPEWYAGFSTARSNGRLYYTRHYLGGPAAWYAELNGTRPLSERVRLFAHLGGMRIAADEIGSRVKYLYDLRVGLGLKLSAFDLQLSWGAARGGTRYYRFRSDNDNPAWVLGLSRSW